ncbi:hypothetical protein JVU11DRAFT_8077 [Chiua virens]|nr:hypothetical protein JVU11DRAFT_8077 [Chiua virens]
MSNLGQPPKHLIKLTEKAKAAALDDSEPVKTSNFHTGSHSTSVDIKWFFSQGRLLLSHIHNQLSAQSTCALLCVGYWSTASLLDVIDGKAEGKLDAGWDAITGI